jgi:hypothetical protein
MSEIYSQAQLLSLISVNYAELYTADSDLQSFITHHAQTTPTYESMLKKVDEAQRTKLRSKLMEKISRVSSKTEEEKDITKLINGRSIVKARCRRASLAIPIETIYTKYYQMHRVLEGVDIYLEKLDTHSYMKYFFFYALEYLSLLTIVDIFNRDADYKPLQFKVLSPDHSECKALELLFIPTDTVDETNYTKTNNNIWSKLGLVIKTDLKAKKSPKTVCYYPYPTCFTTKGVSENYIFEYITDEDRQKLSFKNKECGGELLAKVNILLADGVTNTSW